MLFNGFDESIAYIESDIHDLQYPKCYQFEIFHKNFQFRSVQYGLTDFIEYYLDYFRFYSLL